jgi:PAS domain S-box-containing protein
VQEVIQAIQQGDVDAVVISGPAGDQVFSLRDAEYGYRALVEAMSEGAATLAIDGTLLYCNERLSHLLGVPLETIIGNPVSKHLSEETARAFEALLAQELSGKSITTGLDLRTAQGRCIPVQISIRKMVSVESAVCCMVVTDLTESKSRDELIASGQLAISILQSAAEAIAVCDEEGKIIAGNQALEELCGCNPLYEAFDEVIRFESVDREDVVPARDFVAEALAATHLLVAECGCRARMDGWSVSSLAHRPCGPPSPLPDAFLR